MPSMGGRSHRGGLTLRAPENQKGILLSNNRFTVEAKNYARNKPLELVTEMMGGWNELWSLTGCNHLRRGKKVLLQTGS